MQSSSSLFRVLVNEYVARGLDLDVKRYGFDEPIKDDPPGSIEAYRTMVGIIEEARRERARR